MANLEATFNATDKSSPGYYTSAQTALLLLDFHSKFFEGFKGHDGAAAVEVAVGMITWARQRGIQVIHCLIDLNATPYPTCKDFDRFANIVTALKSNGGEEVAGLRDSNSDNDLVFLRRPGFVSALKSYELEATLQRLGIQNLVVSGISTSGCVLRTAVTACDAEYVVTVLSDGCADPAEGVHDFVTQKLLKQRGYVMTAEEFRAGFEHANPEKE